MKAKQRQPPQPYPRDILFDRLRADVTSGANPHVQSELRQGIQYSGRAPTPGIMLAMQREMAGYLDHTKIFVLSAEAVECVLATANRLSTHGAATSPLEPPVLPLWIEFEGGEISTESGLRVGAMWLHPGTDTQRALESGHFGVMLIGRDPAQSSTEPEFFEYTRSADSWCLQMRTGCQRAPGCLLNVANPLAQQNNVLSGDPRTWVTIDQRRDAEAAAACGCACYAYGQDRAHLLWVLLQMLRAEGATHQQVNRRVPTRVLVPKPRRAEDEARREAYNATHPSYVRIHLNQRLHVRRTASPGGSVLAPAPAADTTNHAASVIGHYRLLIPGEGRPWRGDMPRIVWVRQHTRMVHGSRQVRYHVVP